MPVYSFEALTSEGKLRKGVIEADSAKGARGLLRRQALVPLKVEALGAHSGSIAVPGSAGGSASAGAGLQIFKRRVFNATGLGVWTRQLAGLVSSGLSLIHI